MKMVQAAVAKMVQLGLIDRDRKWLEEGVVRWLTLQGCAWYLQDRGWLYIDGEWKKEATDASLDCA